MEEDKLRFDPVEEDGLVEDGEQGMFEHFRLNVDPGQTPMRVDKFMATHLEDTSRHRVQCAIKEGYVRVGDKIIPVQTVDIVCFVSMNKGSYLICFDGARYAVNPSLDEVSEALDPSQFFRVSRSAIVAKKAVVSADRQPNGKLNLEISLPVPGQEEGAGLEVSRARVDAFLEWLEA